MGHALCHVSSLHVPLPHVLVTRPWIPLLRGFWAVILGEIVLLMPDMNLTILAVLFGIYVLADGAFCLAAALPKPGFRANWWLAAIGLCGILVGLLVFLWSGLALPMLLYCFALWAIAVGLCEIAGAIALSKEIPHQWYWILSGAVAIIFGLVLTFQSDTGAVEMVWIIGSFATIFGILLIATAYRLRKHIVDTTHSAFLGH